MPPRLRVITAGAIVGFLGAVGIWFAPDEPYPNYILAAGTLKGALTALLIAGCVHGETSLPRSLVAGAALGLAASAVVFLAKGGWTSWDAPYVVPSGVVEGLILGAIVRAVSPPRAT